MAEIAVNLLLPLFAVVTAAAIGYHVGFARGADENTAIMAMIFRLLLDRGALTEHDLWEATEEVRRDSRA